MLGPNGDWWWFDTCHMSVADVQILSNGSVSSGEGVYWMFYSGGSFEPATLPAGMSQVCGCVRVCMVVVPEGWGVRLARGAGCWVMPEAVEVRKSMLRRASRMLQ